MFLGTLTSKFVTCRTWKTLPPARYLSSKISSDEKLLNDILKEEEKQQETKGNGYRKTSPLAKYQQTSDSSTKKPNTVPPIGPKYWKNKFRKSYNKVEKGLMSPLDEYVQQNIEVIQKYHKKHSRPLEKRLKVNINKKLQWNDIVQNKTLHNAVIRYLQNQDRNLNKKVNLTSFQQRFFALMSGDASTVAKGPDGCGKSFALLLSALNCRRSQTRGSGINSLILVKSNSLVLQYQRVLKEILSRMGNKTSINRQAVAQFLYRGTPEQELQQDKDLADFATPHILVSTPQRLLDIISSKGMDFVKINSLSFIGVDDFTLMLDENVLLEAEKQQPVVKLLDFVTKLQEFRPQRRDPPPQIVLIVDESATEGLLLQLKEYTKWIDWKSFAPIGRFGDEEDVPFYKHVANQSNVSTVLVLPRFSQDEITPQKPGSLKFKVTLYDMKPFEYGNNPGAWLEVLYRKSFGNSLVYKKHRNSKWSTIPNDVKKGELEILCSGLGKLLKKKNVVEWLENRRALVIHPDELNSRQVVEMLSHKTGRKIKVFNPVTDSNIFKTVAKEETDDAELLVINTSSIAGLTLAGLDTIFVLGVDSIKSESQLATIMGRTRLTNGMIPEDEYTMFSEKSQIDKPRSRTFVITTMLPDGTVDPFDRNFLERSYIVNGLVNQLSAVGVEEKWREEDEKEYKMAINGQDTAYNDDMNIEFGGIHNVSEENE